MSVRRGNDEAIFLANADAFALDPAVKPREERRIKMPMTADEITAHITAALPDAEVEITDLAGDGDHYKARVTSSAFAGLPRVRQHQLVYAALGEHMGTTLHALMLETVARTAH